MRACELSINEWVSIISAFALLLSSLAASLSALVRACQNHRMLKDLHKRSDDEVPFDVHGDFMRLDP